MKNIILGLTSASLVYYYPSIKKAVKVFKNNKAAIL